ncbi:MAG: ROK family protein [Chromatiales bacterium]|nr:ROK family protein [Chromatiales bacterium]
MTSSFDAGFDIGGTDIKYGLVDRDGRLVHKSKVRSPETIEGILAALEEAWRRLKKNAPGPIRSCGFGIAGFYSVRERKILQSPNYPCLDGYPLIPALRRFIDVPVRAGNDANMAAFGEFVHGAGQGVRSLVLLTVGTGIGAGLILDGRLWQGESGFAGEIGHITVNPEGTACACGGRGCLETEASAPARPRFPGPHGPDRRRRFPGRLSPGQRRGRGRPGELPASGLLAGHRHRNGRQPAQPGEDPPQRRRRRGRPHPARPGRRGGPPPVQSPVVRRLPDREGRPGQRRRPGRRRRLGPGGRPETGLTGTAGPRGRERYGGSGS